MDGPTANATRAARVLGFNLESPARQELLERDRFRTIGTFTDDEIVQTSAMRVTPLDHPCASDRSPEAISVDDPMIVDLTSGHPGGSTGK